MREWLFTVLHDHYSATPAKADIIFGSIEFPFEKPPAFLTIDDRAMRFTGLWPSMKSMLDFKPWNKVNGSA